MAASYPTSAKSFTTKTNAVDVADASHINDLQNELTAIETDLLSGAPAYITKVTTGVNASALSTGTVANGRISGSYTGITSITVSNTATVGRLLEGFQTYSSAITGTPTITFDCTTGNVWNITGTLSSNWTANFTNLGLSNSYATAVTLVVNQGATGHLPTAAQIEGTAVTINWLAGTQPTPMANKKDVFAFSILQTGTATYLVLGQLASF